MFEIEILNDEGKNRYVCFSREDIDSICRCCLNKDGLVDLFEIGYKGIPFSDICNDFFVQLSKSDNLPKNICNSCAILMIQFCTFKEQILLSQNLLELTLGELKPDIRNKLVEEYSSIESDNEIKEEESEDYNGSISNFNSDSEHLDEEKVPESKTDDRNIAEWYRTKRIVEEDIKTEDEDFGDENKISLNSKKNEYKKVYTCGSCGEKFFSQSLYRSHKLKEAMKNRSRKMCHICNKLVPPNGLRKHLITHSSTVYHCDICGMKLTRKENIKRHKYRHQATKPHMCHICGKGFIQAPSLTDHLRNHNNVEPLVSQVCGRTFITNQALQNHLKLHKVNPDLDCKERGKCRKPVYTCKYCQKQCTTKQALEIHIRSHTGERPYVCNFCGKRFTQKQHLTGHLRLHNGEKPHICSYCGKSFALKGNLTQHIMIHTGRRPYSCDYCFKGFCTSSSLKKHKRVHGVNK